MLLIIPGSLKQLNNKNIKVIKHINPITIKIAIFHLSVINSVLKPINKATDRDIAKPEAIVGLKVHGPSIICPSYGK